MEKKIGAVILAAGQGKRLKLNVPKPLAPCLSKKLIDFPLEAIQKFFTQNSIDGKITVVLGHQRDLVKTYVESQNSHIDFAIQEKQLGTADALKAYFSLGPVTQNYEYTLVVCADTPIISEREFSTMFNAAIEHNADGVAATFELDHPFGYGRIIRENKHSTGFKIIEEKDATDEQRKIKEVNSGLYLLKTSFVAQALKTINSKNASGEFYLTDIFGPKANVIALPFSDPKTFMGVNGLDQLEEVENVLRQKKCHKLREEGVRFIDSRHTYLDDEVEIQAGTTIYPNTYILGRTKIGSNVTIEMGAVIRDSIIEDNVKILAYSVLENAEVKAQASVGPFARLRPGSNIGEESKIGNFVEIKKSVLDKGVKVSHLSYVGDALIGEETNIGCGFITCNYDGVNKHQTKIGKNCFIGSDSQTVAPVEIGDDCFVASATTVNKNMPSGSFAISRGQQVTKENMAHRFIKTKNKK